LSPKTLTEYWIEARKICELERKRGSPEFPTGIDFIDNHTGGIKRGHIWIIAGKTSSGKTALSLQLARAFADNPKNSILFLSLEMRGWQLCMRMFCEMTGLSYFDLVNGKKEIPKELNEMFCKYIKDIDFEILEGGYVFEELVETINRYYKTKKPDVVFLDFVQQIEWKNFKDERIALMEYIRKIKEMANRMNIAFVIVSQIRRLPSGSDYNRPPDLYDLKGSGSLEQMADIVLLLHKETDNRDGIESHFLNIAKNRHGQTCKGQVLFEGRSYRFRDLRNNEKTKALGDTFS